MTEIGPGRQNEGITSVVTVTMHQIHTIPNDQNLGMDIGSAML